MTNQNECLPPSWRHAVQQFSTWLAAAGRSQGTVNLRVWWITKLAKDYAPAEPSTITSDDPRASLPIQRHFSNLGTAAHPYSGHPMVAVEDDRGRLLFVAVNRMAHERGCSTCDPVWDRFDSLVKGLPAEGSMLTAVMTFPDTEAALLVDAEDMDPQYDQGATLWAL